MNFKFLPHKPSLVCEKRNKMNNIITIQKKIISVLFKSKLQKILYKKDLNIEVKPNQQKKENSLAIGGKDKNSNVIFSIKMISVLLEIVKVN